jgi:6-pyruvoyl-tetrahydropterin synthase
MTKYDGLSLEDLLYVAKSTIEMLEEFDQFLNDELSEKYPKVRAMINIQRLIMLREAKKLKKMIEILKETGFSQWSTDQFGEIEL